MLDLNLLLNYGVLGLWTFTLLLDRKKSRELSIRESEIRRQRETALVEGIEAVIERNTRALIINNELMRGVNGFDKAKMRADREAMRQAGYDT